ncbi:ImmA/IrrE family metallo-endopeptidase [Lysobacter gummosus]|uniref:XRE family transcriptional regulator n=1 Tax=Lysobacter gummosus TaxID=262324 RepID=A0ABY3XD58_9GAMM|nr:XRE family transcriptional regulator [Lysobacter gummosus]UNP29302.1 XRE family transcriptional regulator [Lysobacter gummosus]
MQAQHMGKINPAILRWARESSGLSVERAAKKIGLGATKKSASADRLKRLEEGEDDPTRPLLVRMAKVYHRPLISFYLRSPPVQEDRGADFRTTPEKSTDEEPQIDALIRDVKARQSLLRDLLEREDHESNVVTGALSNKDGLIGTISKLSKLIGFDLGLFRAKPDVDSAFQYVRDLVERSGVFVLLIGDLGHHTSTISPNAFRGYALSDPIAPFIVINDKDAHSAWVFTLLHELCHIGLGETGVSGGMLEGAIEKFCNDVASGMLLPPDDLATLVLPGNSSIDDAARVITEFALARNLSRALVTYRLFRAKILTENDWTTLADRFKREWLVAREEKKARAKAKKSGPSYYVVKRHRVGQGLMRAINRGLLEGNITPTKAGRVLGVAPRNVATLLSTIGRAA